MNESEKSAADDEKKPADTQDLQISGGSDAPAILITGAHHPRELITIQQTLYLAMKLLQGGVVNKDPEIMA